MYCAKNIHSARERSCFFSHLRRMVQRDWVGDCWSSATSSRKSSRSSLADSSRILATSEVETDSPRPFEMTCLDLSRNSRSVSEIRIDRVCCCGFRSIKLHGGTHHTKMQSKYYIPLYRYNRCAIIGSKRLRES